MGAQYRILDIGDELQAGDQYLQDGVWETITDDDWFMPASVEDDLVEYRRKKED